MQIVKILSMTHDFEYQNISLAKICSYNRSWSIFKELVSLLLQQWSYIYIYIHNIYYVYIYIYIYIILRQFDEWIQFSVILIDNILLIDKNWRNGVFQNNITDYLITNWLIFVLFHINIYIFSRYYRKTK